MAWCLLAAVGCDRILNLDEVKAFHDAPPEDAFVLEDCPADYVSIAGTDPNSRYKLHTDTLVWPYAESSCEGESKTKITHLVVFDDEIEIQMVETSSVIQGWDYIHAGFARDACSDWMTFYAVTGGQLPYGDPRWHVNEPDGSGTCGTGATEETATWFGQNGGHYVTDGPWKDMFVYLCECDHVPVSRTFTRDP
jgi:hypothetical protein